MIPVKVRALLPNALGSSIRFMLANSVSITDNTVVYLPIIPRKDDVIRAYNHVAKVHVVYMEHNDKVATVLVELL